MSISSNKLQLQKSPQFSINGNKVFFISLGCPRNLVDTEVMIGILLQNGYEAIDRLEEADVIVINTCGFLDASRQESIDTINSAIKNRKSYARVVATGCMVQSHKEIVEKSCPGVHYLLGSGDVEGILKAVTEEERGALITDNKSYLEVGEVPRTISTPKQYAYIKIAEGCRKRCSYCIIPEIKGPLRSKPVIKILAEIKTLIHKQFEEIILIAQDLGDWGRDLGFQGSSGLEHLLKEIVSNHEIIHSHVRFRLLYVYPDEITEPLIDLIRQHSKIIIPYLDMPIQHANNEILKSMRRNTTQEEIRSCVSLLRKKIPDITIRTSLIVGFPGETEEQFLELCSFIKEMKLDNVGIFIYSKEEKSHSAILPDHIPEEIKERRHQQLMAIQKKVVSQIHKKRYLGKTIEVTIDGYHPETQLLMIGRHQGQCPDIDGLVLINDGRLVTKFGKRYLVQITDISEYDLIGRVIQEIQPEKSKNETEQQPNKSNRKLRVL